MTGRAVMGFSAIVIRFQKKKKKTIQGQVLPVKTCKHLLTLELQIIVYLPATECFLDKEKKKKGNSNSVIHPV